MLTFERIAGVIRGMLTSCGKFHGFPDLAVGWRYQIPILLQLEFRVIAVDCLGYGETVSLRYNIFSVWGSSY